MNHLPRKYGLHSEDQDASTPPETAPKKIMLKVPLAGGSKDVKNAPMANLNGSADATVSKQVLGLGSSTDIIVPKQTTTVNGGTPAVKKSKVKSPSMAPAKVSTPTAASSSTPVHTTTQAQTKAAYTTQPSFTATSTTTTPYTYTNHYTPQSYYAAQASKPSVAPALPTATTPAATLPTSATPPANAVTLQTSKPVTSVHPSAAGLRLVRLVTKPIGRKLDLTNDDGVKTWAMRLAGGETSLIVRGVRFAAEEEEEEAEEGEDEHGDKTDGAALALESPKKKRGRGRPRKLANVRKAAAAEVAKEQAAAVTAKPASAGSKQRRSTSSVPTVEEVVVKLDGLQVEPKPKAEAVEATPDADGEWDVELNAGSHILEIGKKGSSVLWKVYVERRNA